MALLVILLAPVVAIAISAILLPRVFHMLAELLGRRLRRSSTTRRDLLLARVAAETKSFEAEHREKTKEDDDWEKIVPSQVGSAVNGGTADAEWSGIVGFFHPFWYALKSTTVVCVADTATATQEAAASESCGQPSEPPRSAGRMLSA